MDLVAELISGRLKTQHPDDESMRVSANATYRSLFIQAREVLQWSWLEGRAITSAQGTLSFRIPMVTFVWLLRRPPDRASDDRSSGFKPKSTSPA